MEQADEILRSFTKIVNDVNQNKNLERHNQDIKLAITQIEKSIDHARLAGTGHDSLDSIRNKLYELSRVIQTKLRS